MRSSTCEGVTLWFTGLPCSGKSAVADRAAEILKNGGYNVERLDGDIVRQDLTRDLGFSKEDRDENIRRVTFVAKLLTRNNVIVLTSFISPYKAMRGARPQGNRLVHRSLRQHAPGDLHPARR